MKKLGYFALLWAGSANAALFSLSGNYRVGGNWFYNLDQHDGENTNASNTTQFLEQRILLRPDVMIDDHFSINSEVSMLAQRNFNNAFDVQNQSNQMNGGTGFDTSGGVNTNAGQDTGNNNQQQIYVRYAYLKWNSDIGVFRAGRMPKGWGLGLMYDEGSKPEDDASTIVDRIGFEGQLADLTLGLGFEKREEGNLFSDIDDDEVYEGSVKYTNEGSGVTIGLLFGRHIRGATSQAKLDANDPLLNNPVNAANPNLSFNSSNDYSFFAKKEWEEVSIGGEFASTAYDKQGDVFGALAQLRYHPGNWELEADGLLSTSSNGQAFIVHPNYRPFLILFNQPQGGFVAGQYTPPGSTTPITPNYRFAPPIGYDPASFPSAELGALLGRFGAFYSFSQKKYKLGMVAGWAKLMKANNYGSSLGYEADLHFDQKWYDNFKTALVMGAMIPGNAYNAGLGQSFSWGGQLRAYLDF